MHRALTILEVVEAVCCELPVGGALAALAATCKTFQNPALDILWRTQDSIILLLGCIPDDLFNTRPDLSSEHALPFMRAITPSDWERSHLYFGRVKKCEFEFIPQLSEIFTVLEMAFSCGCIFPGLRSLSWSSNSETDFRYIRLFLAPTLSTLSFEYHPSIFNSSLLSTLARTCPQLSEVDINIDYGFGDVFSTLATSSFLLSLQSVKCLTLPRLNQAALQHIGQLRSLTYLCMENLPDGPYPPADANHPIFQNLRNLIIRGGDFEPLIQFLRRSAGEFDMCDSTLAKAACAWPHLTTLTLHIDRPSQTWPSPLRLTLSLTLTLDATILPPLIRTPSPSISRLTHLCIAQSPISNLGAVTRFLSDIFPHVRTINLPFLYPALVGPTRSDALRVWKQVQDLLPDFLATRKEERS
ncbi:hypothetical protein C8R43DRAFT_1131012 [Mycena crocata]|nr:hypothetical protein C8R43DRAFT_1131012 [Mycena crocata]